MIDTKQLAKFLIKAKMSTYAAWDLAKNIIENDKSTSLIFEEWEWKYHDNYFGGEPFGGREIVFFKNSPVFIMTYYWQVIESIKDFKPIYNFLQKALSQIPEDKPFRGPENFNENNLCYINKVEWQINNFFWEEIISSNGKEIYKTRYMWWLVDQRK